MCNYDKLDPQLKMKLMLNSKFGKNLNMLYQKKYNNKKNIIILQI